MILVLVKIKKVLGPGSVSVLEMQGARLLSSVYIASF